MEKHEAYISTPQRFAIDSRMSREKYVRKAIESTERVDRVWNFQMSQMFKRHERQWLECHAKEQA